MVLKIHTEDKVADLLTKAFDVSRGLIEFRESLRRVANGTEALLISTLFILWLDKVSIDSAKLVPLGKVCTALETLKKNTAKAIISLLTTNSLSSTMAVLDSCSKHNMVTYLEKSEGNAEFNEIIDFLKRSSIHHALTVSPVVSTTFVATIWTSTKPSEDLPTPSPAPTSEVPHEPQTDSSPAQTSEVPIEHQPNLSPRPSPTTIIPDSIPETSGENLGGHSSSDKSLSGNEGDMTLQSVYDLCLSLCCTVDHMETENAQDEGRTREMVDEDKEMIEPIVSTDGSKVSIDKQIESTDGQNKGTEEKNEGTEEQVKSTDGHKKAKVLLNMNQAKAVSREKGERCKLKDIEDTDRPRPTSTRLLLTLKPLPKIDPKDKGKKKIKEVDESESESDGIPEAKKKLFIPERINGDLMVMFNPDDENEFWNSQQDWNIVSWKLHSSSVVHTLVTEIGLVIHMLVEKKYPLRKKVLVQMLKLKLESEEDSTMAIGS
ncbi:hypothetical protein Tco_0168961 [Tanacetum coccineum]